MKEKLMSLVTTLTLGMMSANMVFAIPSGINPGPPDLGDMSGTINKVLGAIQGIGYVVAIIMIMYIGIKYLTAGAGEKAKVKDTMVPMLVGAILVVAATTVVKWLWGIAAV